MGPIADLPEQRPRVPRPSWTTGVAVVLVLAVTTPFVVVGVRAALAASAGAGGRALIGATVILAACVWSVSLAVGLLGRRPWARDGVTLTFLWFGAVTAFAAVGRLASTGGGWWLVGLAVLELTVVALAWSRHTEQDLARCAAVRRQRTTWRELVRFRRFLDGVSAEDFARRSPV